MSPAPTSIPDVQIDAPPPTIAKPQTSYDIGTMTLSEAKAALYGPEFARELPRGTVPYGRDAKAYGVKNPSDAPAEFNATLAYTLNPFNIVQYTIQWVAKLSIVMALFAALARRLQIRHPWIASIMSTTMLCIYRMSAPSRNKGAKPSPLVKEFPIVGAAISIDRNLNHINKYMLAAAKAANFETMELRLSGGNMLVLMDIRDREYLMKAYWFDFVKNTGGAKSLTSSQFAMPEFLRRCMLMMDGPEWQEQRKVASVMFSGSTLDGMLEKPLARAGAVLNKVLTEAAMENKSVNMQIIFQGVIFDMFCDVAFGRNFDTLGAYLSTGKAHPFSEAFDGCMGHLVNRMYDPPLIWMWRRLISKMTGTGVESKFAQHVQVVDAYVGPLVREIKAQALRQQQQHDKHDGGGNKPPFDGVLRLFVEHGIKTGSLHMLEDEYLMGVAILFMVGGRDTTASTMTYMTAHLTPEIQQRMACELEPYKDHMTTEQAKSLSFTNAIINETWRLSPPAPMNQRSSGKPCVLPSGVHVRPYTRIIVLNAAIGRDPKLWHDPDEFIPERWMRYDVNGKPIPVKRMDEIVVPTFFGGPRVCPGKDMSRFEVAALAAHIFTRFQCIPENPNAKEEWDTGVTMFMRGGLMAKVKRL